MKVSVKKIGLIDYIIIGLTVFFLMATAYAEVWKPKFMAEPVTLSQEGQFRK